MTDDHPLGRSQTNAQPLDVLAALPLPEAPYRGIEPFRLIDRLGFFFSEKRTRNDSYASSLFIEEF